MDDTSQQIDDWAAAVVAATNWAQVRQIWQTIPRIQEDAVLDAVAQRAVVLAQAGDERDASRAQIWHAQIRQARCERDEQPPYVAAIHAFLQAADETAVCQVFGARRVVLQPYEAQVWLDRCVADATEEERAHLTARAALLRTLRGVAPVVTAPPPLPPPVAPPPATTIAGDLLQAGQNIYLHSAHVEGAGSAVVINNIVVERRWQRPTPPTDIRRTIRRTHDLQQVVQLLADRGQVAISGPTAAAVQGMPGIGKTTLARQLARDLDAHYPDGVIWQEIGPQIGADQVQRILNQWAQVALLLPPALDANVQFDPGAVRALFRDRCLLVILDDVWSLEAVRPLREALPGGAHLILTTRLETVTVGLGGGAHVLGILTPEEARALITLRLDWSTIPADHQGWCDALAQGVGYHTLALDVALGVLRLDGDRPEDWQQTAAQVVAALRTGQGFDDLQIPDGDREQHVERVLAYSYECMDAVAQERFRLLGAMAEGNSWATAHIAQIWQCDERTARRQMNTLVNAALLRRTEQRDRWQQHSLLRGYALALLRRAGAAEAANAQHAAIYDVAMQQADDAQHYHTMLPDYPQVRHAVAWAMENDFARAQQFISNVATMQEAFGFVREGFTWSRQARDVAQQRGTAVEQARAQVSWGNALQRVSNLVGEDRSGCLYQGLEAYNEALRFYRSDTVPLAFALTQNNRGNLLSDLATLSGEERATRLRAALVAYDEALRFARPDTAHDDFAMIQTNRGTVLSDLATLSGEERATRLRAALAAYDEALRFARPDTAPRAFATTQTNRGNVLRDLASLPEEDRAAHLRTSLEAYDEALRFASPDMAPPTFATVQSNRGLVLRDLADLPGEDRAARLRQALAAYDEALRFADPDTAPIDFAIMQSNRGLVLRDLAYLSKEDRAVWLCQALAACDEALRFARPDTAPIDFAIMQNSRGAVLRDLAYLSKEDRAIRLRAALVAYDEALRFARPDNAPHAFALTQHNRGMVLHDLASLPGEDRGARLYQALEAHNEALRFRPDTNSLDFVRIQRHRGDVLSDLASVPSEDSTARLRAALAAYDEALRFVRLDIDFAMMQGNRANFLYHLANLSGGPPHDCRRDSLQAMWIAWTTFTALGCISFGQQAVSRLRWWLLVYGCDFLRYWEELHLGELPDWLVPRTDPPITGTPLLDAFLASVSTEELNAFWQQVPLEEEQPFLDMVEQAITEAAHAGNSALAAQLSERLAALNRLRNAQA